MRYIGLDPSLSAIGYAVLEDDAYVNSSVFHPYGNLDEKLECTHKWFHDWLFTLSFIVVAIETPFVGLNANTHYKLSMLSGVLRLAVQDQGMKLVLVAPTERAKCLDLKGNASKETIAEAVNRKFGLDITDFDETDAVAISWAGRIKSE